ncbi:DUF4823 domain-containing protein [Thalassospira profundimaris]|uniref:DUF4823 domain-containing protein n=1 Tax=Thalassospira profundimaris TaxID=502049 RepID=A0A367WTH7_9PROT|nr:DUF4823 domain-containing protein [Thalassospira profundimaris]RCK44698.1 hypothetical protein TH30_15160 [Thalassospira profundimaris]
MKLRRLGILCSIAASLALGACSSKYRTDNHQLVQTVAPGSSFYVMQPADGTFGSTNYVGSGAMLTNEVYKQLIPFSSKVVKATSIETRDEAFQNAANLELEFLIDPQILHWEDRATEWSGRPDRITIHYQAYNVSDQKMLATSTLSASSKWATFGGDHPVDLLPVPTKQFLSSLLGKSMDLQN